MPNASLSSFVSRSRRPARRAKVCAAFALLSVEIGAACGGATTIETVDAAPSDASSDASTFWDRIAASPGRIYSFVFNSDLASEAGLSFALHDVSAADACKRYPPSSAAGQGDFWFLSVTVSASAADTFAVVDDPLKMSRVGGRTALVSLVHQSNGDLVGKFPALSGTVTLATAPDPATAKSGSPLDADVRVEFPYPLVRTEFCRGGAARDGGQAVSECSCRDEADSQSTCELGKDASSCCFDNLTASRTRAHLTVKATHCPAMCLDVVGGPNLCAALVQ